MASNNMYRVGDFVYFETSAGAPYQIRKIEELNKTTTGAVEAKVVCFYRRRDLTNSLLLSIDKINPDICESSEEEQHMLKHRELFITRQLETLPATHIRGKAHVTQFNENELLSTYTSSENTFFYKLIYDSAQKTLTSGKNSIKVGSQHQARVPCYISKFEDTENDSIERDGLIWDPDNKLDEDTINNFITVCRSLGTYARACDLTSSVRQPNLAAAAAAASRDITLTEAHNRLHEASYNFQEALLLLTPKGSPSVVRDELEEWSASEGKLFEEGLGKYGKFFNHICNDFIPWKNPKKLVEFYYMWKTSQHYLQLKRIKRCENEHKLKQVYIPNYTKPNPAVLFTGSLSTSNTNNTNTGCESCGSLSSGQWFAWGPPNLHCKLCDSCWNYWKRYGGLKNPTRQDHQTSSTSPLPTYNAIILNKTVATHLYQCPQIGCDKHFRQAGQLYSHMSAHPGLLESLDLLDQNNPSFYEEFKNQKNGFLLCTSDDFKFARRIFKSSLKSNFRMARCFNKDNRRRLAFECMTKARLKNHFLEFIKSPKEELLHKKYSPRNFGSLSKVIEKKRRSEADTSSELQCSKNDVALPNSRKRPMPIFDDMEEKRIFLTSSLTIPKRLTISNEAVCMVPTFIASTFIKECRLNIGNDFMKKLCRKPFFDHSLYNILNNH